MIVVRIWYPYSEGQRFDEDYYFQRHIPMTCEAWGVTQESLRFYRGLPGPKGVPAERMVVEFRFPSLEALKTAMSDPRSRGLSADVPNYSDTTPEVSVLSEV